MMKFGTQANQEGTVQKAKLDSQKVVRKEMDQGCSQEAGSIQGEGEA